jgi:hypothetical protein
MNTEARVRLTKARRDEAKDAERITAVSSKQRKDAAM